MVALTTLQGLLERSALVADVLDANRLNDRTHGAAGDNAGTGSGGLEQHIYLRRTCR